MPNWCNTSYVFEGSKKEIADLYKRLHSLKELKEPLVQSDFGNMFLGCIVNMFGGNFEDMECRGFVSELEDPCGQSLLRLSTITAWTEKNDVWDFVSRLYPSVEYYYYAEEGGCCYHITNDYKGKYFPERFIVEQDNDETTYHKTKKQYLQDISERIGISVNNLSKACREVDKWNKTEQGVDNKIHVSEIEVV